MMAEETTRYSEDNPDHVPSPTDQVGNVNTRDEGSKYAHPEDVSPVFNPVKGKDTDAPLREQFVDLLDEADERADEGREDADTPISDRPGRARAGAQTGNAKTALPDAESLRTPEGERVNGLGVQPSDEPGLVYSTPETNEEVRSAPSVESELGAPTPNDYETDDVAHSTDEFKPHSTDESESEPKSEPKSHTVTELRAFARKNDVDLPTGLNKAEIEQHLRDAGHDPDDI